MPCTNRHILRKKCEKKNKLKIPNKEKIKKVKRIKKDNKKYCYKCGKVISRRSKTCVDCYSIIQRKIVRPEKSVLLNDIKELGYKGTGKKYGVSDNAIRKWIKK